jgi:hypothetical protein
MPLGGVGNWSGTGGVAPSPSGGAKGPGAATATDAGLGPGGGTGTAGSADALAATNKATAGTDAPHANAVRKLRTSTLIADAFRCCPRD